MAFALALMMIKNHECVATLRAFEGILRVGGAGVLVFDHHNSLKHADVSGLTQFEALCNRQVVGFLNDFIAYVFDRASDEDALASNSYSAVQGAEEAVHFREMIMDDNANPYLVEMYKGRKNHTIAVIRNVILLKAKNDNLSLLSKINAELNLAIEATSCAVFIVDATDADAPVVFLNRMCKQLGNLLSGSQDSLGLKTLLESFERGEDMPLLLGAGSKREPLQKQIEFEKDGELRWFDFRFSPILKQDGHVDLCVGVLNDISELKIREAEFFKAQKLDSLGQLSAGIAHDFNNILSIIEGYARMVEMNPDNPDAMLGYSKKIRESSARAAGLTKKMMAFARHKQVRDKVCDVGRVLDEQIILLKPLLDESIFFNVEREDGNLIAQCAGDDFVQIIMNLVVNARDAMPGIGRIDVSLMLVCSNDLPDFVRVRDCDYLRLSVRDNGAGMPQDVCERIFDPFFTTKEQGKGTGLGLSVVYGLVRDAGGYIDVHSELSVGSVFQVYLPCGKVSDMESKAVVLDNDGVPDFNGYTALVVEDEPDLKEIVAEVLQRHGMNVLEASSGNEALVVQDDYSGEIDLLLTDLVMPGVNGLKLAGLVQSLAPDLALIYMSGYPARGENAKVDIPDDAIFISKPIDFDILLSSISGVLDKTNVPRMLS